MSSTGYGSYTVSLGTHIAHGHWDTRDNQQSSTSRELKAIFLVIQSFTHLLNSKKVKVFTDNQNTMRIATSGSAKLDLQAIAVKLYHYCISHNILLECQWIPREEIKQLIVSVALSTSMTGN